MFDDLGDHYVGHGFWCVQIPILQHWQMDCLMGTVIRCIQHLQKIVVFHKICEMGLCPRGWTFVYQG